MIELEDHIHAQIKDLCETGDSHVDESRFDEAIRSYESAWGILPDPPYSFEAATWILVAIADSYFLSARYEEAFEALRKVMVQECPGSKGSPFIRLRRGQCLYEIGDRDKAAEELTAAYMLEGKEIFTDEDPKYFDFLKTKIRQPAEGW